jgi:surface antigen
MTMRTETSTKFSGIACVASALSLIAGAMGTVPANAGTSSHGQAKPIVEFVTPALDRGARGSLDVDALQTRACELSFSGPEHRHQGPFVFDLTAQHVRWSWRVPASAASGHWTAVVACAASRSALKRGRAARATERLVLHGGAGGAGIVASGSLRVSMGTTPPTGHAGASGGNVVGLGSGHNPFPYGQCTYHAYETRGDIYDFAVAHGIPTGGVASSSRFGGIPDYWWNAWRWLSNAQRVGIPTGSTPVVGALAVFPRGYGGSAVGHVAYVEHINPDGTYVVSERNWNYDRNITVRLVHPYPGVGFIYGGPAGNGPQAPPPPSSPPTTPPAKAPTPSPSPSPPPAPPPAIYVHHVYGTCADGACGVNERSGPGYSEYAIVGNIGEGGDVDIVCQTHGELVTPNHGTASTVWDRLTNGAYVTDVYVDTPGVGGNFSPPIPQC